MEVQFDKEQTKSKLFLLLSYGHKLQQQDVIFNIALVVVAYFMFLRAQKWDEQHI